MHLLLGIPILAFLLGSVPFGLLIAKFKNINIREHGSGNIGATNVLRVVGKKYGITCFVLDFLKGLIPTLIGINLIQFAGQDFTLPLAFLHPYGVQMSQQFHAQGLHVLIALLTVLGHNYSPWVGFKGGKGIATSAGALVPLMPFGIPILAVIWYALFKITRYVSIASMGAALSLPLLSLYGSWKHGKLQTGEWNKALFVFCIVIALMAVWKHRSNIKNLLNGTEYQFGKKEKNKDQESDSEKESEKKEQLPARNTDESNI